MDKQEATQDLKTVRDFLRWAVSSFNRADIFYGHGTDNAWDEAVFLITHVLALPPEGDKRFLNARLTTSEKQQVLSLIERRVVERIPAAYLTGEAWFAGLPFYVDERVLIPRSPIAELIDQRFEPWLEGEPASILDLCAGSGCIGIACAYEFPDSTVDLGDISPEALAVAQSNIYRHDVDDRVRAVESDLFGGLEGCSYDLIVCNPPYVDVEDLDAMPREFHYEPRLALESGNDGLDFTRRLLAEAADYLNEGGILVAEVGNSWATLENAFPGVPFTWLDLERGGHGVFMLSRDDLLNLR